MATVREQEHSKYVAYLAVEASVGRRIGFCSPGQHSSFAGKPDSVLAHLLHVLVGLEMLHCLLLRPKQTSVITLIVMKHA